MRALALIPLLAAAPALAGSPDTEEAPDTEEVEAPGEAEEATEPEPAEEADAALAEAPARSLPPPEVSPSRRGLAPFVGAHVGPAFALSPLSTSVLPRLELGVELPFAQRRIRSFVTGAWSRPLHDGGASDDRVEGGAWSHRLYQSQVTLALGASIALVEPAGRTLVPELAFAPELFLLRNRITGGAGGASFPESTEYEGRLGGLVAAGVRYPLGPGELTGHLTWHTTGLDFVVTGESTAMQLVPSVGYRIGP